MKWLKYKELQKVWVKRKNGECFLGTIQAVHIGWFSIKYVVSSNGCSRIEHLLVKESDIIGCATH